MAQSTPPEFILEAFSDPTTVQDVVRGILHAIFFHRFFPTLTPQTRDVLDLTLPLVDDVELETMIDQRVAALARQLDKQPHGGGGSSGRGQISVQFFEKKRRKTWLAMRGEEEVCWECWTVKVTVAEPRTESERAKVRKATEATLLASTMKIITFVNAHKDHIPPITTTNANPFPYQISVNQQESGWTGRIQGMY